jgi:hypothetical protein
MFINTLNLFELRHGHHEVHLYGVSWHTSLFDTCEYSKNFELKCIKFKVQKLKYKRGNYINTVSSASIKSYWYTSVIFIAVLSYHICIVVTDVDAPDNDRV